MNNNLVNLINNLKNWISQDQFKIILKSRAQKFLRLNPHL